MELKVAVPKTVPCRLVRSLGQVSCSILVVLCGVMRLVLDRVALRGKAQARCVAQMCMVEVRLVIGLAVIGLKKLPAQLFELEVPAPVT